VLFLLLLLITVSWVYAEDCCTYTGWAGQVEGFTNVRGHPPAVVASEYYDVAHGIKQDAYFGRVHLNIYALTNGFYVVNITGGGYCLKFTCQGSCFRPLCTGPQGWRYASTVSVGTEKVDKWVSPDYQSELLLQPLISSRDTCLPVAVTRTRGAHEYDLQFRFNWYTNVISQQNPANFFVPPQACHPSSSIDPELRKVINQLVWNPELLDLY